MELCSPPSECCQHLKDISFMFSRHQPRGADGGAIYTQGHCTIVPERAAPMGRENSSSLPLHTDALGLLGYGCVDRGIQGVEAQERQQEVTSPSLRSPIASILSVGSPWISP